MLIQNMQHQDLSASYNELNKGITADIESSISLLG